MSSPWQILGLDPDAATEKDVKVAYARLIKVHRPDSDPEGFQRVRQAYEMALTMLKNGTRSFQALESAPDFSDAETQTEPPSHEVSSQESLPPALIEAELEIARARQAGDQAALEKAIRGLQQLCLGLRPGRAGWQLWLGALHRATEGKSALVAASLPVSQLINELESGTCNITHVVIGYWEESGDADRLVALAESLLADKVRLQNREAAMAALRLGIATGFLKPALATALGSFAFPHVDREARDALLPKVEEQAAIGNLMIGLRMDQRHFWHQRVRQPRFDWDWSTKEADDALNYLVREKGPHWSGYGIVKQIVPPDWFSRLEKEMGRVRGGLAGRIKPPSLGNPRPVRNSSGGGSPWRYIWVVFLVISSLARLVNESGGGSSRYRYESPPFPHTRPAGTYVPRKPLETSRTLIPKDVSPSERQSLQHASTSLSPFVLAPKADPAYHGNYAELSKRPAPSESLPDPVPLSNESKPVPYRTKKSKEKADQLRRNGKPLDYWLNAANELEAQASQDWKGRPADEQQKLRGVFRQKLHRLMEQVHASTMDASYEYRLLDVLLFDPDTSPDQRDLAMIRMTEVQSADFFVPKWEEAASLISSTATQVAARAAWYLQKKGSTLLPDVRQRLDWLATHGS